MPNLWVSGDLCLLTVSLKGPCWRNTLPTVWSMNLLNDAVVLSPNTIFFIDDGGMKLDLQPWTVVLLSDSDENTYAAVHVLYFGLRCPAC